MDHEVALPALFNYSHIQDPGSVWTWLRLALYFPVGVALIAIRSVLVLLVCLVIAVSPSKRLLPLPLIRIGLWLFGLVVRVNYVTGAAKPVEPSRVTLVCCNHTTAFDVFPFLSLFRVNVLIDKHFFSKLGFVSRQIRKLVGALTLERSGTTPSQRLADRERIRRWLSEHISTTDRPLLFFPEGWDTSGKHGLLQYQQFLFSRGLPVLPTALRVSIPLLPLEPGMLGSSLPREVFWLLFAPITLYDLTILPQMYPKEGESGVDFARRVQVVTANELGVVPTNYSFKDALKFRSELLSGTAKIPKVISRKTKQR